jgi:hypothetical protein
MPPAPFFALPLQPASASAAAPPPPPPPAQAPTGTRFAERLQHSQAQLLGGLESLLGASQSSGAAVQGGGGGALPAPPAPAAAATSAPSAAEASSAGAFTRYLEAARRANEQAAEATAKLESIKAAMLRM